MRCRTGVLSLLAMMVALAAPAFAQRDTTAESVAPATVEASCVDVVQVPSVQVAVIDSATVVSIDSLVVIVVATDSVLPTSTMFISTRDSVSAIETLKSTAQSTRRLRSSAVSPSRSLFRVAGAVHNRLRLHATVRT